MKIVFFTGSGISQESGIPTFRDRMALWDNFNPEDLASKTAWRTNKENMLKFHNDFRRLIEQCEPNSAHYFISQLENEHEVIVVTQNVDNLHERAGAKHVVHLHGELLKSRSTIDPTLIYDCQTDIKLGDTCEKGSKLRPHIVWFGEMLDETKMYEAKKLAVECDVCVVIGSSMQVYPANSIPHYLSAHAKLIVIDPAEVYVHTDHAIKGHYIQKSAVEGMKEVYETLMQKL